MNLGRAVRMAREARGWTVNQLAERLDSRKVAWWVGLIESEDLNGLGEDDAIAFAAALDMPLTTLLFLAAEEGDDTRVSWQLAQRIQSTVLSLLRSDEEIQ